MRSLKELLPLDDVAPVTLKSVCNKFLTIETVLEAWGRYGEYVQIIARDEANTTYKINISTPRICKALLQARDEDLLPVSATFIQAGASYAVI